MRVEGCADCGSALTDEDGSEPATSYEPAASTHELHLAHLSAMRVTRPRLCRYCAELRDLRRKR